MSVRRTGVHFPRRAWFIAFGYFVVCWLIAWATGALSRVLDEPLVGEGQTSESGWLFWGAASLIVVIVGYWYVWPMGTFTNGRPLTVWTWVFGLLWGVSEGLLLLSVQTLIDGWFDTVWVVVAVTFVVLSTDIGLWHALFWDWEVAPSHNIEVWNLRKVLFVHTPNLIVSTTFLTLYDNAALFVLLQTIALVGSAVHMRFPAPTATPEKVVLR